MGKIGHGSPKSLAGRNNFNGINTHGGTQGVDLAGLLGGRMASAEGGSVSSGVAYVDGCPLSSRGVWGAS